MMKIFKTAKVMIVVIFCCYAQACTTGNSGDDDDSDTTPIVQQDDDDDIACTDADGDGYGFGEDCRGPDCDDNDPTIFASCPGDLVWVAGGDGQGINESFAVTALSDSSAVITGNFCRDSSPGCTVEFNPSLSDSSVLTSGSWKDMFLVRYTPDGGLAWAKGVVGASGSSLATLDDGSFLASGSCLQSSVFGADEPGELAPCTRGESDAFIAKYRMDGSLIWAKGAGSRYLDYSGSISARPDGSFALVSHFCRSYDPYPGECTAVFETSGGGEIALTLQKETMVLSKHDAGGNAIWAKIIAYGASHFSRSVTLLNDGSTIVAGYFCSGSDEQGDCSLTFYGEEATQTTLQSRGGGDIFIAAFDAEGSLLWARGAGGTGLDAPMGITSFASDSFIIGGAFSNSLNFSTSGIDGPTLTAEGEYDIFIARYDPDGNLIWAKQAGGPAGDLAMGLSSLPDGSFFISGSFGFSYDNGGGEMTLGKGTPAEIVLSSAGDDDAFIARYNADGQPEWARSMGGSQSDWSRDLAVSPDGTVYLTGDYCVVNNSCAATFGAGEINETTLTIDGDGVFITKVRQ